ncbi:hypothetical protein ABBQ38_001265 [Trebouxia sp. C0009 RCD-2024]
MPLGRSNCAAMEGWQSRLQAKILTAGVVGAFTGAVLSVLQQKRFFKHSLGTAASCMVCVGGFAACQETSRLLRCEDSAANSVVAGAATGALLLGLQRGRSASLPAAIVCSGAAGIGHLLYDTLQPVQMFQNWLVDNDLMDSPGMRQQPMVWRTERHPEPPTAESSEDTWGRAFGIKHLSDAEWEEHQRRRKAEFDQRLAKAGLAPGERMIQQRSRPNS